jgi:hypothetical protein
LLRPENLDKETEEDERRRVVHQRYVDKIMGGRPSALRTGGGAAQKSPKHGKGAMFATGDSFVPGSERSGEGEQHQAGDGEDEEPEFHDGIDVYSNSPFIQHFLLTHNCNPQSLMRSSRIDFAAYYAALPNSSLLAGESIRINDEVIAHYERLSAKTADHIRASRRYTKTIKEKLEQHRDAVLATSTHDYSSRIVSIVAQRDQLRRKALAQELGRATAMGSGGRKGRAKKDAKPKAGQAADADGDDNAIDETTAPSRVRENNAAQTQVAEEQPPGSPPGVPAPTPGQQSAVMDDRWVGPTLCAAL